MCGVRHVRELLNVTVERMRQVQTQSSRMNAGPGVTMKMMAAGNRSAAMASQVALVSRSRRPCHGSRGRCLGSGRGRCLENKRLQRYTRGCQARHTATRLLGRCMDDSAVRQERLTDILMLRPGSLTSVTR